MTSMPSTFTWGRGGVMLTPEQIEKRRRIEDAVLARGVDTSPVGHWSQGLARVADALAGSVRRGRLDKAERESSAEGTRAFDEFMTGIGGQGPSSSSTVPTYSFKPRPGDAPDMLIEAVINQESGGNPNAVSAKGAQGLMQIMPDTARDPGFGVAPMDPQKAFDPAESKRFGTDYLNAMLERYGGDRDAALVAYNAGPGTADKWVAGGKSMSLLPQETRDYVSSINASMGQRRAPANQFAQTGGIDPSLIAAASNPHLSESQRSIANLLLAQKIKQSGPKDLMEVDGRVFDPNNRTFLTDAAPKEQPSDVREYEYYASQERAAGRQPKEFNEYQIALKEAGRPSTSVNIDQKAQGALEKSLGESVGKAFGSMYEEGAQAGADIAQIERLRGLLSQSGSGLDAGLTNMAASFGIDLGENAGAGQAANAIINYLTPRQRVPGTGASSDRDVAMFKAALPSLMNLPEGNALIMDTMQGLAEHKRAMGDIAGAVVMGEMDPKEAVAAIRALKDPFAKFKEASEKKKPAKPVSEMTDEELEAIINGE